MQLVQPINKCQNVVSWRRGGGAGSDDRGCHFLKTRTQLFFTIWRGLGESHLNVYIEGEHMPNKLQ